MNIVRNRKIFYWIAGVLMATSLFAVGYWGLNLGIDFRGGSIMEVEYADNAPNVSVIRENLAPLGLGEVSVRPTGEQGFIIRSRTLSDIERSAVIEAMGGEERVEQKRFNAIGPVLGREAAQKSLISIALVIIAIILFIAFAFRKVSEPVSSWKYGLIAIVALVHDILIPTGAFAILGQFLGYEIDTLFVTALLVILGFSVHDTIVVFDRVRENLRINREQREDKDFDEIVGASIRQTIARSINTSLTTLVALVALYFLGPDTIKNFSLALIIGIAAGTYSSIFLASPLLVTAEKMKTKKSQ